MIDKYEDRTSPFRNDPFVTLANIFKRLYPEAEYKANWCDEDEAHDENGEVWYGLTIFPYDGGIPEILVNGGVPMCGAIEVFAHELAHVVTPNDEHGFEWKKAFTSLYEEYYKEIGYDLTEELCPNCGSKIVFLNTQVEPNIYSCPECYSSWELIEDGN